MFRRGLAAALLLGASGAAASAADLDVQPSYAPQSTTPRWEGFSFGGYVSGNWSTGQTTNESWYAPYPGFTTTIPTSFSQQSVGGGVGVQAGYDKQFGQIVTGVMADYGFVGGSKTTSNFSGIANWPGETVIGTGDNWINKAETASFSQQLQSLGTARWRLGYAIDPDWLVYGSAGLAFGETVTSANLQVANGDSFVGSRSGMSVGYTIGGGVQYAMGPDWSLGLDALYYNLGNRDNVGVANFTNYAGAVVATNNIIPSPQVSTKTEFAGFQLRLTALYQFDGASQNLAPSTDPNTNVPITVGVRAGYSTGQTQAKISGGSPQGGGEEFTYKNADSFTAEPFFNMELPAWGLYLTGFIGLGQQHNGSLQDQAFATSTGTYSSTNGSLEDGQLQYGVFDLGYNVLQNEQYKVGVFLGYTFENDNYNSYGCSQTANNPNICSGAFAATIGPSTLASSDQYTWNAARLGMSGSYKIGNGFSISGDAAWLPYVHLDETNNRWIYMPGIFTSGVPASATSSEGFQVAAKVDYQIAPGFDIGGGVRYWWMTARGNANYNNVGSTLYAQSATWTSERAQAFLETGYHF